MSTVADRIKKIIVDHLGVGGDEVSSQASLVEDLRADSLDVVEIVMMLEDEFQIEIDDLDAEEWVTVGDAIAYVEKKAAR